MAAVLDAIARFFGLTNGAGLPYLFWSGIGSDLGEIALLGVVVKAYTHLNCTQKGCWRIAKHPVDGTPYRTCHRHATVAGHAQLHEHHAAKHPDQHELLNARPSTTQGVPRP